MLAKIAIVLAVIVVLVVVVIAMQPPDFSITRSITITAQPPVIFGQVNDFHNWDAWSPWAKIDPTMKQTYEGSPAGKGAIYNWAGNNMVGQGRMTITESSPSDRILIDLQFMKPLPGSNIAEFTFKPQGTQTVVTWKMSGKKSFLAKAIHLVMNMDKLIGGQFETGLAQLKSVAEAPRP
jgi:hypothetical protein